MKDNLASKEHASHTSKREESDEDNDDDNESEQSLDEEEEFNPFDASEDNKEIIDLIYKTHDDDVDEPLDYFSAYLTSRLIIQQSHVYFDHLAKGTKLTDAESKVDSKSTSGFVLPMRLVKEIGAQIAGSSFKDPEEVHTSAHKATIAILEKVKDYGWDAKAVLVLSAWAFEFGHFAQSAMVPALESGPKQLDISLAHLTKSPLFMIAKPALTTKTLPTLLENLALVRTSSFLVVQVMDCIMKLQKLIPAYEATPMELEDSELAGYFYWIIISLVVSAAKLSCIIYNEDDLLYDYLEPYNARLSSIEVALNKRLNQLYEKHEDANSYWSLLETRNNTIDFQHVFERPYLYCYNPGYSYLGQVNFDSYLRYAKPLILVISSGEDVEPDDFKLLQEAGPTNGYLLWIPTFDQWNETNRQKIYNFSKNNGLPSGFLVLGGDPTPSAIRFLREEWNYVKDKKPTTVVIVNKDFAVDNICGVNLITRYRPVSNPFDKVSEAMALETINWPKIVAAKISDPQIISWMKHRKRYIFVHGGTNLKFPAKLEGALKHATQRLEKKSNTKLCSFCIGKNGKDNKLASEFWETVEHLYADRYNDVPAIKDELHSLYSLRYERSWVLMCQGPRLVMSGPGDTFIKALKEFDNRWDNDEVIIENKDSFEAVFKDCYAHVHH